MKLLAGSLRRSTNTKAVWADGRDDVAAGLAVASDGWEASKGPHASQQGDQRPQCYGARDRLSQQSPDLLQP